MPPLVFKRYVVLLCITCSFTFAIPTSAQHLIFGIETGFSSYFGDLAPYSAIPSTKISEKSIGHYFGFGDHRGSIYFNYTRTSINATDAISPDDLRNKRNLHFRSPISEYGVTLELSLAGIFFKDFPKIEPLITTGLNVFTFNPQAYYNNEWIDLQPLGTEGQGSSYYPHRQKYDLRQLSLPLGGSIRYNISKSLFVGMGVKARMTFTDYLDDVSTTYPNNALLSETNGSIAAELSIRGDELDPNYNPSEGYSRGNPNENDWYMTSYIIVGYRISTFRVRKSYKIAKKDRKRSKIKCPTLLF